LSYKEKLELEGLPQKLDQLETEQQEIYTAMADAEFFKKGKDQIVQVRSRLKTVEADIANSYERWEQLERIIEGNP
jgi:ATP-binding cassette subfamily F protein uup